MIVKALLPVAFLAGSVFAQVPAAIHKEGQQDMPVTPETAQRLLNSTAGLLDDNYVFRDRVPDLKKKIGELGRSGDYRDIQSASKLADRLSLDIQKASGDRHLRIEYSAEVLPVAGAPSPAGSPEAEAAQDAESNFGFQSAQVLEGNIGYLDVRFFPYASEAGDTVVAAMNFVAHTRALIVDLRQNHGGDAATVALILSYFFGNEAVHLNDIYWRPDDSTGQFWTQPFVPGHKFRGPIYVLIGPATFSAGEEFAYDLQEQHRATIVGQPSGGGAHPITRHRIDEHFLAFIPSGRAINPVTHTDWEGTGVAPDVVVPEDKALAEARSRAISGGR